MTNVTRSPITRPKPTPRKTEMINIRLTPRERRAIETLAAHFDVTISQLVRHFLMQIADFYFKQEASPQKHNDHDKTSH
ncbi:MAG: hypothetical protein Kow0077_28850 [Anaerolineae bacterium]